MVEMVVDPAARVNRKAGFLARFAQGLEEILAAHVIPADRLLALQSVRITQFREDLFSALFAPLRAPRERGIWLQLAAL